MVWLKRPDFLLPPDIGFNFFNGPVIILLIFKILMQFAHIVFEFQLRFQKMRAEQLKFIYFLSQLLKAFFPIGSLHFYGARHFLIPFFLLAGLISRICRLCKHPKKINEKSS